MEPEMYSNFMNDDNINMNSIIIAIENNGWLKKNALDGTYVNWIGDIYKKEVYEKKWRDYFFWDTYTEIQIEVLSNVVLELCEKFKIPCNRFSEKTNIFLPIIKEPKEPIKIKDEDVILEDIEVLEDI